jgi:hypothetical protein
VTPTEREIQCYPLTSLEMDAVENHGFNMAILSGAFSTALWGGVAMLAIAEPAAKAMCFPLLLGAALCLFGLVVSRSDMQKRLAKIRAESTPKVR